MRNVRSWVRRNARDYILGYFHTLSEPCKDAYALHLDTIKSTCIARSGSGTGSGNNNNNSNVHVARARAEYRRNIDRAWALAVKRYPDVLNHFYSLVRITLPNDDDPVMKRVPGIHRPPKGDTRHRADHRKPSVRSRCGQTPTSPQFPVPPAPRGASSKGPPAPPPPRAAYWQTPPPSPP